MEIPLIPNPRSLAKTFGATWLALGLAVSASAQIRIGQTAGYTGIAAASVKEMTDGATLYLDAINAQGGINGQRVELLTMDDKFEPKLAAENARRLVVESKVIALFLTRGTPHNEAIFPVLDELRVPLIAPSTGAMSMHQPVRRWVFNVRATYQREAEKAVQHLTTLGFTKIALLQVNDSFGNDGATGAMAGFTKAGLKPVLIEKFERAKPDFAPIVAKLVEAQPQGIVFLGTNQAVADGTALIREAGLRGQIVTLSNNASAGFIKALGPHAHGTVVAQVFPGERAVAVPMVKELTDLATRNGSGPISPAMLEGYAGAKVLVEGLRRAGRPVTGESLAAALETLNNFDIGGLKVSFSAGDHTGLDFADLSIVGSDGRFRR
jgi:ABC-type branched-subunit amino acid transport system substrate-binding protein